ncbi:MAG: aminodeoxychorismate synthase component I [Dehalococcoidales bacterium]|nr:aminodeoxychorismate synthase component I [Dehalococcoidales bacterium]
MRYQSLYEQVTLPAPLADVFAVFADWPQPVWLDSSLHHSHLGRYSYLAADPFVTLAAKNGALSVCDRRRRSGQMLDYTAAGDPFAVLQNLLRQYRTEPVPGLPPFQGGAVGYFAYDLCHHTELLPRTTTDDLTLPDLRVGLYAWTIAHDHLQGQTWLIVNPLDGDEREAEELLRRLCQKIAASPETACRAGARPLPPGDLSSHRPPGERARVRGKAAGEDTCPHPNHLPGRERELGRPLATDQQERTSAAELVCNFTRDDYLRAVAAAKEYIAKGDIYQVCLSQRFSVRTDEPPLRFYRRLREISPVSYGAYLAFPEVTVVSASPELFLRLEGRRVETRPIKGTRPRGTTPERDEQLVADLVHSVKDRAENVMIVDLLRNDIGRVCRVGSVQVPDLFRVESYSTVHHLVSTVTGELRPGLDAADLLRACFPGGSVTGCPKIRSMEIIDELEPTQRSVYCGSIGFLSFAGDMDTSIVIRTALVKGHQAYFQVGGAILADSDPAAEYQETLDKARALLLALGQEP